jgi:Gpi18-like mannosyltransferase
VSETRLKVALVIAAGAVAWAYPFATIATSDLSLTLSEWYSHIIAAGPVGAFSRPFSNYSPPYLYLLAAVSPLGLPPLAAIKGLSAAGALWLAFAIYLLTGKPEAGAWSLFLPTVVLNVPFLAQADVFWLAPCVLAVAAAVRGDPIKTALWASIGFAFKAQAVFLAPFVALVLFRQKAPLWAWVIPLGVYFLAILPAWLVGWPFYDLIAVYVRQAEWHLPGQTFISTAPNLWMIVAVTAPSLYSVSVGLVAAAGAAMTYIVWLYRAEIDPIVAAALSAALIPFMLPGMHERFFALAEILTFCLAWGNRRFILIAVASQVALLLNFFGIIGGGRAALVFGVAAELTVIMFLGASLSAKSRSMISRQPVGFGGLREA